MLLSRFFARNRLINLQDTSIEGALDELLATFPGNPKWDRRALLQSLLDREKCIPTCLGNGITMPHLRIPMGRPCLIAVGRCPRGIAVEGRPEYVDTRLIFLILFNERDEGYLQILANLARILHDPQKIYQLTRSQSLDRLHGTILTVFGAQQGVRDEESPKIQEMRAFLQESFRLSVATGCTSVFLFADAVGDWRTLAQYFTGLNRILVTERSQEEIAGNCPVEHVLTVSNYSPHRLVQLRSAILLALSRGLLRVEEKVCCIGGIKGSDCLDSLLLLNVAEEYRALLNARRGLIPKGVKPEVFERLIAIAHEIAMEGREGRPVGTMFVVGNHEKLKNHYRALVLNPFQGYPRQERNMLNPFMDETIKEFAAIDGAFIVDGEGVLEAAGVMVQPPESHGVTLQGGLGTRHTAAAAFTKANDCLAVVISQSTGQVSLFRNGQMLPLVGKIIG
jgi:DNA integrity scanning protein DisA with diadenylate cyclase activity/mannitol/fructose-specific phosphotransferase system IIA component (Ntr-type)